MRFSRFVGGITGIVLAFGLIGSAPATAATLPAHFAWVNGGGDGNHCLGINSQGLAVLWTCKISGSPDQIWHLGNQLTGASCTDPYNQDCQYINGNDKCLGVQGGSTARRARLVEWSCLTGHEDQYWLYVGMVAALYNTGSGLVMGVLGGGTTNGSPIVQWEDLNHLDQEWFAAPR
jgi:hypothetical protein